MAETATAPAAKPKEKQAAEPKEQAPKAQSKAPDEKPAEKKKPIKPKEKPVRAVYEMVGTKRMLTKYIKIMVQTELGMVARQITFKGNFRTKQKGQFRTSEPALIKAMDDRIRRAGRRTDFILVRKEEIDPSEMDIQPLIVETNSGELRFIDDVDTGDIKAVLKEYCEVGGVSNYQQAAEWLKNEFKDLKSQDVNNRDKTLKVAEEKKIKFIDLN